MIVQQKQHLGWILVGAVACACWGISGIFAKALFAAAPGMTAFALTQMRMIISGGVTLLLAQLTGHHPLRLLATGRSIRQALVYGLVGLVPNQLFYFLAVQYGNAAIATILQFIGPFFIMLYMAVVHRERPSRLELISAVVAFFGVVVVATNGRFTHLALTIPVLVFGLLSAVGAMTDTLTPRPLMDRFGSLEITGWGLLIGGIVLTAIHPQLPAVHVTGAVVGWFTLIVVVGTIFPFVAYTTTLRHVSPTVTGLLDAFEPLAAMAGSVLFMGLHLTPALLVGSLLIIVAVMGLSYQPRKERR